MDLQPNLLDTLRRAKIPSRLVEDFRPMAESLEWRLSEQFWMTAGTRGFMEESVPYSSTSGGAMSQEAAALLLENCRESPPEGPLVILELCAGSGLFARSFLTAFQRLCVAAGQHFHEKLIYYVTDGSPATVSQWRELGIFEGLPAITGRAAGRMPRMVETESGPVELNAIRAVFCNYGFDSMPSTILRRGETGPEELQIRTHLTADAARLRRHEPPPLEEIRERVERLDPSLQALAGVFEIEPAFRPCARDYPLLADALRLFGDQPRVILNYGAMESFRELLPGLEPAGFLLFSDFGVVDVDAPPSHSNALPFGESRTIGLHFPFLAHFVSTLGAELLAPESGVRSNLHSRLLIRAGNPASKAYFTARFGGQNWTAARTHIQAGALEEAKGVFEAALEAYPHDWSLLGEAGEFLVRQVIDYEGGLALVKAALALNPWYSPWLWNVYGDAHYGLQRFSEAVAAYRIAEEMAPRDVRTQLNLSYGCAATGDFEAALAAVAKGFAHDGNGEFRDRLRDKQLQILGSLRALQSDVDQARELRRQRLNAC